MSTVNLESALRLAENGAEGKETDLADGFYARVSYGKLWMLRRACREAAAAVQDVGAAAGCSAARPRTGKDGQRLDRIPRARDKDACRARPPAAAADSAASRKGGRDHMMPGGVADMPQRSVLLNLDFDLVKAKEHVVIRNRMPGDRISPLGMKGSKKLQDYFCRPQDTKAFA